MSIDPEQLLKLAKDRHGPAGVTLGWPMVVNIVDELRRLQWEREALTSLATERAQFILNAVELGYCQLPDSDTPDRAHDTYERCKLADSEAVARRDNHPDDQAVDRFSMSMKAKLAAARAKGRDGWDDPEQCSASFLADLLVGHVGKGNAGNLEDIANLAMMLHQRGEDPAVLAQVSGRRDARMKVEALEAEAENGDYGKFARDRLLDGAAYYRGQSEEAPCSSTSPLAQ